MTVARMLPTEHHATGITPVASGWWPVERTETWATSHQIDLEDIAVACPNRQPAAIVDDHVHSAEWCRLPGSACVGHTDFRQR